MTALSALKLARDTGVKVRPKGELCWYSFDGKGFVLHPANYGIAALLIENLINNNGPVEWEVVD